MPVRGRWKQHQSGVYQGRKQRNAAEVKDRKPDQPGVNVEKEIRDLILCA